jgi:hypothetical protein
LAWAVRRLIDNAIADQLRALGAEVSRAARQFQSKGSCDYAGAELAPVGTSR